MNRFVLLMIIFHTTILFAQWDQQSTPTSYTQWSIRAVNNNIVWASGYVGTVLRTTDGGANWSIKTEPETNFRGIAIDAIDENTAWIAGNDNATTVKFLIYKTTNGGATWGKKYDQNKRLGFGIRFFDANNGLSVGGPIGNWTILTTTDGGDTWNEIPETDFPACETALFPDPEIPDVFYESVIESGVPDLEVNGDHAWFVSHINEDVIGKPNYIYHSTDRGYHWTKHAVYLSGGEATQANVAFKDENNGVIVGEDGTRGYTTDGGTTWTLTAQTTDNFYSVVHVPASNAFVAVGNEKSTHVSDDIGRTWTRYYPGANSGYFLGIDATETKAWACGGGGLISVWNNSVALPVELVDFAAIPTTSGTILRWTTSTEVNNYGFEVERKTIGNEQLSMNNWEKLGFVEGNGTTNSPKSYNFVDANAQGKVSYRLKQIDRDGKFEYSQEVEAVISLIPQMFSLMQNYPNPFNPVTMINYQLPVNSYATLKVYDALGREVAELVNEVKEAGSYAAQFDGSKLSSGIYFYTLKAGNFIVTKKLLLMK